MDNPELAEELKTKIKAALDGVEATSDTTEEND